MQTKNNTQRWAVVGTTGTGKSFLAQQLASRLHLDHIELDALHWGANWQAAEPDEFRARVEAATRTTAWVTDGNYHAVRDIIWSRAQTLVWLDYGFWITFTRLLKRTWQRVVLQEELWNGNRERLGSQLKLWSQDSLIHWFFKSYWRRKREFPALVRQPDYAHLNVLHFQTPRETDSWLSNLT